MIYTEREKMLFRVVNQARKHFRTLFVEYHIGMLFHGHLDRIDSFYKSLRDFMDEDGLEFCYWCHEILFEKESSNELKCPKCSREADGSDVPMWPDGKPIGRKIKE